MPHFLLFPTKIAGNLELSVPVPKWTTFCQTSFPNWLIKRSNDMWKVFQRTATGVNILFLSSLMDQVNSETKKTFTSRGLFIHQ